jgi:hypothetical protein
MLEQAFKDARGRAFLLRLTQCAAHLPSDLTFADHQRVKARGNREQVVYNLIADPDRERPRSGRSIHLNGTSDIGNQISHAARGILGHDNIEVHVQVDLESVARSEYNGTIHAGAVRHDGFTHCMGTPSQLLK